MTYVIECKSTKKKKTKLLNTLIFGISIVSVDLVKSNIANVVNLIFIILTR